MGYGEKDMQKIFKQRRITHLALFPVQVELVLADGHRPDTFCEGGGGREPRVHVNVSWSKGSPTHGHPVEERVTRLLKV